MNDLVDTINSCLLGTAIGLAFGIGVAHLLLWLDERRWTRRRKP